MLIAVRVEKHENISNEHFVVQYCSMRLPGDKSCLPEMPSDVILRFSVELDVAVVVSGPCPVVLLV